MKIRCFFGLRHGKWHEVSPQARGNGSEIWPSGCQGGKYFIQELVTGYPVLIAEGHHVEEALDWLFTYQPDHPQHSDDDNHPLRLAKADLANQSASERRNRPGMSGY